MSNANGTALSAMSDVPLGLGEQESGAFGKWLRKQHLPDVPDDPSGLSSDDEPENAELAELEVRQALDRRRVILQRDPTRLELLSPKEQKAERAAAERLRRLHREQEIAEAEAKVKLAGRDRQARQRIAKTDHQEQCAQRAALSKRRRLMDPTSRLASHQRAHVLTSLTFAALAVACIARMAWNVGVALEDGVRGYLVEPAFTGPLLVLMWVHAQMARAGRRFPVDRRARIAVIAVEVMLFLVSTTINTGAAVVGPAAANQLGFIVDLAMPALLVAIVRVQPLVAEAIADALISAHVEVTEGEGRLSAETNDLVILAERVRDDFAAGVLRPGPDGGPSISHAQKLYGVGKRRAQGAVDLWRKFCAPRAV